MYKLRYTPQAREDLIEIKRYIERKSGNRGVALRYTEKLRQQCRKLALVQGIIGTMRPEIGEGIRSFPHGNYIILFIYEGECLDIVTIVEGHRDLENLL